MKKTTRNKDMDATDWVQDNHNRSIDAPEPVEITIIIQNGQVYHTASNVQDSRIEMIDNQNNEILLRISWGHMIM